MTYISGFTNIATGKTIIDNKYHETYSIDDLYVNLIKPTLFNHGVVLTEKFLAEALCKLPKEYKMEVDMFKNRVLLKREAVKAGYIYNSKKQELLYSFFFEKVTEQGIQQTPEEIVEEEQSEIEEIEEVESKIVEKIEKVNEEIKKPDFIEELTIKLSEKTEREVYQEPLEQPLVKTEFQLELEKEVDLREKRKKSRETKLQKKKERRTRKLA
jgi:hypothetical protein